MPTSAGTQPAQISWSPSEPSGPDSAVRSREIDRARHAVLLRSHLGADRDAGEIRMRVEEIRRTRHRFAPLAPIASANTSRSSGAEAWPTPMPGIRS